MLPDAPFAGKIQSMERQLTDKQMHTLRFVHDYIKSNGRAPSQREIGEASGISMTAASYRLFYILELGYLWKPRVGKYGRNIALTEKGISVCESFNDNRRTPTN